MHANNADHANNAVHASNETDILQEILSVAHVSQELINNSGNFMDHTMWGGENVPVGGDQDFTFATDQFNQTNEHNNPMRYADKSSENPIMRSLEIEDLEDEFKMERMSENLRWVGMSSNVNEVFMPFYHVI